MACQPNLLCIAVLSAEFCSFQKNRLIRISGEKFVEPAAVVKNSTEGLEDSSQYSRNIRKRSLETEKITAVYIWRRYARVLDLLTYLERKTERQK